MSREQLDSQKALFFTFTCVKNGRQFILRLFDSLLKQTKKNFIHYIYDDGSTEPLDDMVEEYKQKVSKLVNPYEVIYEKNPNNIGLNMATKHCIDMCSCPYFIWIDCDNFVDSRFFEEMEKGVVKHKNATVFRTRLFKYDEKNDCVYEMYRKHKSYKGKIQLKNFLYSKYAYSFFAINYNKYKAANPMNHFENIRTYFNDTQVLFSCALCDCEFAFIENAIGYYLSRDESESHVAMNGSVAKQLEMFGTTVNSIKPEKNDNFASLKKVVISYYDMLSLVQNEPKNAFAFFRTRQRYLRENNIPKQYHYRDHNVLFWSLFLFKKKLF